MRLWIISALFISGCATTNTANQQTKTEDTGDRFVSSHQTHFPHTHQHGTNCGHSTEKVGFDTVYLHDGHKHKVHGDHVDDIK